MSFINFATKEIMCKIVYYGAGLCGKTTNLQYIYDKTPKSQKRSIVSLATESERTIYFDFFPLELTRIAGFSVKFQLYTVPGQVYYNATRKLVLDGTDGIVFVIDSQIERLDATIFSFQNLYENVAEYKRNIIDIPLILQYNKRDLSNILSIPLLEQQFNYRNLPSIEAIAIEGNGVFKTLQIVSELVLEKLHKTL